MNATHLATIFNTWAAQYAADPAKFGTILNADGKVIEDYGEHAAACFERIAQEAGLSICITAPEDIDPEN